MVALHEASLIEGIEVKHPIPNRRMILAGRAICLERDIRHGVVVNDRLQVRVVELLALPNKSRLPRCSMFRGCSDVLGSGNRDALRQTTPKSFRDRQGHPSNRAFADAAKVECAFVLDDVGDLSEALR